MEEKQRKRRRRRKQQQWRQQEERTKRQEECVSGRVISRKQITVKQQPEGEKKMSDATACCRRHGGDRRGRRSCPQPRLHTQRSAQETLTGGLVAAFRDSISAWVIHTLLVDCRGARKVDTCSHGGPNKDHLNKDGRLMCTSSRCAKVKISWTPVVTSSGTRVSG